MNQHTGAPKVCVECGDLHFEVGKMCYKCGVCPLCGLLSEDAMPHLECAQREQMWADHQDSSPLEEMGE